MQTASVALKKTSTAWFTIVKILFCLSCGNTTSSGCFRVENPGDNRRNFHIGLDWLSVLYAVVFTAVLISKRHSHQSDIRNLFALTETGAALMRCSFTVPHLCRGKVCWLQVEPLALPGRRTGWCFLVIIRPRVPISSSRHAGLLHHRNGSIEEAFAKAAWRT